MTIPACPAKPLVLRGPGGAGWRSRAWLCLILAALPMIAWGGSPARLRELKDEEIELVRDAMPGSTSARANTAANVQDGESAEPANAPADKATAGQQSQRRLLVVWLCNAFFHESIPTANKAVELLAKRTDAFSAQFTNDMSVFSEEGLAPFDAVLLNNCTRLDFSDPARQKALLDFVQSGKGLIGIHAAGDNFYRWPEGAAMLGGVIDGDPWEADGTWAFRPDDPSHPLNAAFGGKGFKVKDQVYRFKLPYSRNSQRVLVTLDLSDPATAAVSGKRKDDDYAVTWIKKAGNGRVFYFGFGHNREVFYDKALMQHLFDGIRYALGDLEADDSPAPRR